jgi:hypothetical protein
MMIQRTKLINDAIEADVHYSIDAYYEGYTEFLKYKNVEVLAELLGLDVSNLKKEVYKRFYNSSPQ